jgi:hypothetical protein
MGFVWVLLHDATGQQEHGAIQVKDKREAQGRRRSILTPFTASESARRELILVILGLLVFFDYKTADLTRYDPLAYSSTRTTLIFLFLSLFNPLCAYPALFGFTSTLLTLYIGASAQFKLSFLLGLFFCRLS